MLEMLKAEIERLHAENAKLRWQLEANAKANQGYAERNADLAGVNKKLRAALEELLDYWSAPHVAYRTDEQVNEMFNRAHAALNEETK